MIENAQARDAPMLFGLDVARQKLGGIAKSTLYGVCRSRGISFVKLGSRSFLTTDQLRQLAGGSPA